jgi:hypothetical protein
VTELPNELSLDPGYPGYVWNDSHREYAGLIGRIKVSLDDEPVEDNCVAFNVSEGYVVVYRRGPDGSFVVENDDIKLQKLYGKVAVSLAD